MMNAKWQIAIEGVNAREAIESLNELPELELQWEEKNEITRDVGVLAILATVITMTGGVLAIAEQVRKWRDLWKKRSKNKKGIEKIILIHGGRRLILDNATEEQIIGFIRSLE